MHPIHAAASKKASHAMKYPLTPFFVSEGTGSKDMSTVAFSASGFHDQNHSSNTFADPNTHTDICGTDTYKVDTIQSHVVKPQDPTEVFESTWTRDIVFVTTVGSESIGIVQTIVGNPWSNWQPSPIHSQTQKYYIAGNPSQTVVTGIYVWKESTLSNAVTPAYLTGKLASWKSESDTFRFATDNGIREMDYLTESTDARCKTQGGHYIFDPVSPFSETLPEPAASDGDLWNGNHFIHARVVTRQLSPSIYTWNGSGLGTIGMDIYNAGFSQTQLSDEIIANPWKDEYGIFEDDSTILDDAPKVASSSLPYSLSTGDGADNEVVFISRSGTKLRITIEVLTFDWNTFEDIVISSSLLETDSATFQVSYVYPTLGFDDSIRVGSIEKWVVTDEVGGWVVISDYEGELPIPSSQISDDACDLNTQVLFYYRERKGSVWGFTEFKAPYTTQYRTKTYTKDLSIETTLDEGGCGGAISGSFLLNVVDEYSDVTGLPIETDVTDFEMDAGGIDWTVEDYKDVDAELFGTTTIDNTTTLRKEESGSMTGRFELRMDSKQHDFSGWGRGKIISEAWVKIPATKQQDPPDPDPNTIYNTTGWEEIPSASAGQCVTVEGIRLSEN